MLRTTFIASLLMASSLQSAAAEQGDFLVRLRGIVVAPTAQSGDVLPSFPGGQVDVENGLSPEVDFTYFLTDNIGVELIAATTAHTVVGEGALAGVGDIADLMVLPPTLTFQYHFNPEGVFRPYVGVGVNWSIFYSEDASPALVNAVGPTDVAVDDSVGVAYQAGFDVPIGDRWVFNADVKWIQIDTTATLTSGPAVNTVDIDLDPIVAGIGIGYRF
ncbi:MAG: OmpW family protein [Pseudomonadota bacterium]